MKIRKILNKILKKRLVQLNPSRGVFLDEKEHLGVVYMLHRVCDFDEGNLYPNENMKITPQFLEAMILDCKKQGFDFLSLDEVHQILLSQKIPKKKFIAFTLDDGYKDNFEVAYPVFKKHNVPFAIFVATDFPDKKAILWWYSLEKLIVNHDSLEIEDCIYDCSTYENKCDSFIKLRHKILNMTDSPLRESLESMFARYSVDWSVDVREHAMSWQQIVEISKCPLCTIGGHTMSHPVLNVLTKKQVLSEVTGGLSLLESKIGKKIEHFAYPYGTPNEIGKREFDLMSQCDLKTCFCAGGGCVSQRHYSLVSLPRIMLAEKENN